MATDEEILKGWQGYNSQAFEPYSQTVLLNGDEIGFVTDNELGDIIITSKLGDFEVYNDTQGDLIDEDGYVYANVTDKNNAVNSLVRVTAVKYEGFIGKHIKFN